MQQIETSHRSSLNSYFVAMLATGVLLRVLVAVFAYPPSSGDPVNYLALADALRSGQGFVVADPVYGQGLRALYPPLYPLLLAILVSPLLLSTLCDLGSACLLRKLEPSGLASALLFLWPSLVLNSYLAQKESLVILLAVALMVAIVQRWPAWLFGVLSGLLLLCQPALILLPPSLLLLVHRPRVRWLLAAGSAGFLVMLPWWIRNWLVLDAFVPLTTSGGLSFAYAVHGGHFPPPDGPNEIARSAAAFRKAWGELQTAPYIVGQAKQAASAFFVEAASVPRAFHQAPIGILPLPTLLYLTVVVTAVRSRSRLAWRFLLAGIFALLPVLPMEFGERHRLHLLPILSWMVAEVVLRVHGAPKVVRSYGRFGSG